MAEICPVMRVRSSSLRSRRASVATQRAWSRLIDMAGPQRSNRRHLERLALLRALDATGADARNADAAGTDSAILNDLDALQIRLERAPRTAGDLAADAAQVFRLAATRNLIAKHRLLAAYGALHAHRTNSA